MEHAIQFTMPVTKSEGSKRVPVGEVQVFIPTLASFGLDAAPTGAGEDGIPTYATNELNWLQNAIKGAALANARNKLVPQTTTVKDGQKLPTTLAELTEPSLGGGNPEALKAIAAVKALYKQFVSELGKSAKVQVLLVSTFDSPKALAMQPAEVRAKIAAYIEEFVGYVESNNTELDSYQISYIERVVAACADEDEVDLDDL